MASPSAPSPHHGFFHPGPPIPFNTQAHNFNAPSALGFGFGGPSSSSSTPNLSSSGRGQQSNPFALAWGGSTPSKPSTSASSSSYSPKGATQNPQHQLSSGIQHAGKKRRQEDDAHSSRGADEADEAGGRAIRRLGGGKRVKGGERVEEGPTSGSSGEAGKAAEDEADVGVLLASLPPTSHLPILLSLLSQHPHLRTQISTLIPPLDITFCIERLEALVQTIREKVPLGAVGAGTGAGSGFGGGKGKSRMGAGFGFGAGAAGVSEGYVMNRLEGGINEFCSAAQTYLPHFLPTPTTTLHPSQTHSFLSPLTNLLTQLLLLLPSSSPLPFPLSSLITRLLAAWQSWAEAVDKRVNAEGGMFGRVEVEGWWRSLEGLSARAAEGEVGLQPGTVGGERERLRSGMEGVRRGWEGRVGWLIGRGGGDDRMDEDEL